MSRLLICLLCLGCTALTAGFTAIENGENRGAAIIIPDSPSETVSKAATELNYYLKKSTGVELPVYTESAKPQNLKGGFQLRAADSGKTNSFTIKYADNFIFITGVDTVQQQCGFNSKGTLAGVYRWLFRQAGVRWLWPGESGEYIPPMSKIVLDNSTDETRIQYFEPSVIRRNSEWVLKLSGHAYNLPVIPEYPKGHAFSGWVKLYAKTHPEWFSLEKYGQRKTTEPTNMCLSNPQLQDELVRLWLEQYKKSPFPLALNVSEADRNGCCYCENCLAMDGEDVRGPTRRYQQPKNISERVAKFALILQEKARKYVLDAQVIYFAYHGYFKAPRLTKLNKDVIIYLVPDIPFPRRPEYTEWLDTEYRAWQQSGATLYLRPNYTLGGYVMPEVWYDQYDVELKTLLKCGIHGLDIDGPAGMFATLALNLYVIARLMGEPEADAEKLAEEFYSGFGAAAPAIREYHRFWQKYLVKNTKRINDIYENSDAGWYFHGFEYSTYSYKIFPPEKLEESIPFLEQAAKLADQSAQEKIAFLRAGLDHAILCSKTSAYVARPDTTPEQAAAAIAKVKEYRKSMPKGAVSTWTLDKRLENRWVKESSDPIPENPKMRMPEKWLFITDPNDEGEAKGYYKPTFGFYPGRQYVSTWKHLEQQGIKDYLHAWYGLGFALQKQTHSKVLLWLGAVDESCKIWVNGQLAHTFVYDARKDKDSWKKPMIVDITPYVKFESSNKINIKLTNQDGSGGIWKKSYILLRDDNQEQ